MDRELARRGSAVLPLALVPMLLAGCLVDAGYNYWVLNDSDQPVTIDVREQAHRTWDIPPHTYAGVFSSRSISPDWTIALVDGSCQPVQVLAMDPKSDLVYIGPDGSVSLASGLAWGYGSRTAKQAATTSVRATPCPVPSASPR